MIFLPTVRIKITLNMHMEFTRNGENCSEEEVYRQIDANCFQNVDPSNPEDLNGFVKYITKWIKGTVPHENKEPN